MRTTARRLTRGQRLLVTVAAVVASSVFVGAGASLPAAADEGTPLIDWTFQAATAPAGVSFLGQACLTGADPSSAVGCPPRDDATTGPVPTPGTTPGWLQLTNASTGVSWAGVSGGLLYDTPLPASAGLVATFDQAQYGGDGADGIAFFLADGSYTMRLPGAYGGSLGYAPRAGTPEQVIQPGVVGGYLGVGLDAYGNFSNDEQGRGRGCPPRVDLRQSGRTPDSIALRGPGRLGVQPASSVGAEDWIEGYCLLASNPLPGVSVRSTATTPPVEGQLDAWVRRARVTVAPQPADQDRGPEVLVEMDFRDGRGFVEVLRETMPEAAPPTYTFGFTASTGGSRDVHLIRNVSVATVDQLPEIALTKQVADGVRQGGYAVGETIRYQFVVYNTGTLPTTDLTIEDASLDAPATCPRDDLEPGGSTVCTGVHTITAQDLADLTGSTAAGQPLVYAPTATAHVRAGAQALTSPPSAAPVRLKAPAGSIVKSAVLQDADGNGRADLGETVRWEFAVTGDAQLDLADVHVVDPTLDTTVCGSFDLAAGATHVCDDPTLVSAIDADDILAGVVSNTAWAAGLDPDGATVTTLPSTASVAVEAGSTSQPPTDPTPDPGSDPVPDPAPDPGSDPVPDPGSDPVPDPGSDPVPNPGSDPAPDPGSDPAPDPGTDPSTDPAPDPAGSAPADPVSEPPAGPGSLPQTGAGSLAPLAALAAASVALGTCVLVAARRRACSGAGLRGPSVLSAGPITARRTPPRIGACDCSSPVPPRQRCRRSRL
ncbi:DUF7507 domain-containing protein [Cellulomonas edaphi]|uniref:DUF7507 domain-containing protein n=1 Tax=Cellulomonas edaphi TaxID=3053468 RepID=A0ABT7S6E7_9CELL|nr:hypothetical protein [Cellulomons edaphi]MDM7831195.1 hypothetical protein [Cellulomons edaphi]